MDQSTWWKNHRKDLLALHREQSPIYVYHLATIEKNLNRLRSLKHVHSINYAVKANPNPSILKMLVKLGAGFDCVSIHEVKLVRDISLNAPIIFTANFAPLQEYRQALATPNTYTTIDNPWLLANHPFEFARKSIFLRVDPGQGFGHHPYVETAGKMSKFGMSAEQFRDALALCQQHDIRVVGLHAHVGSGIAKPQTWANCAKFLTGLNQDLPNLRYIDVGGGFAASGDLDLAQVDAHLGEVMKDHPKLQVMIEPGRFLVAESGVILAKVTQLKKKSERLFIGIDAGMNALIRPALYGANHPIVNLSKMGDDVEEITADVVGPICESADVLARDLLLPVSEEGDSFLIANCGAYGHAMASTYNSRPLPKEKFIKERN